MVSIVTINSTAVNKNARAEVGPAPIRHRFALQCVRNRVFLRYDGGCREDSERSNRPNRMCRNGNCCKLSELKCLADQQFSDAMTHWVSVTESWRGVRRLLCQDLPLGFVLEDDGGSCTSNNGRRDGADLMRRCTPAYIDGGAGRVRFPSW